MEGRMGNAGMAVTISRQMGSGGTYVGIEVARALGFLYVDREILRRAADLLKRDEASLEGMEEGSTGFVENLLRTFVLGSPETYTPTERPVYDRDLFNLESRIIREIVKEHNAVIMGRGGFNVLKGRQRTVSLFVHAPRDYRTMRLTEAGTAADPQAALGLVEESDRRRTRFVKDMIGAEWTDARNYHLSIDTSPVGPDAARQMAIDYAKAALGV
jgi:cytidylate kinase